MKNVIISIFLLGFCSSAMSNVAEAEASTPPRFTLSDIEKDFTYIDIERAMGRLEAPYYTHQPEKKLDGFTVGEYPNKKSIEALVKAVSNGEHPAYDSLLIAHKNTLLFESYFAFGRVDLPHYQASASKTYTALAVGRAIQLGYLTMDDLHKPIVSFFPEIDTNGLAKGVEKITLDHTLSMRSGLRIADGLEEQWEKTPELIAGKNLALAYFKHTEAVTADSQIYHYQSTDPRLTMLVLDAAVPVSAEDFIQTEVLNKLGINQYHWEQHQSGLPRSAYGTSMTSRDMLKWGSLLMQNGKWKGEQLISPEFMQRATGSVAIPTDDKWDYTGYQYGYFTWGKTLRVEDMHYKAHMAWGGGTQMVIAIPEAELVVVVTARARAGGFDTMDLVEQKILPSFSLTSS